MRTSRSGLWIPPKAHRSNTGYEPLLFFHDGHATSTVTQLPLSVYTYSTWSIYHHSGVIWTLDYDATTTAVHDGRDTPYPQSTSVSQPHEQVAHLRDDWASLSFNHLDNLVSFAGRKLSQQTLRIRGPNQHWALQILPDRYAASEHTQSDALGGLIGELPLLIGLMALSIPEAHLRIALPQLMEHPWQPLPPSALSRGAGCTRLLLPAPMFHTLKVVCKRLTNDSLREQGSTDVAWSSPSTRILHDPPRTTCTGTRWAIGARSCARMAGGPLLGYTPVGVL